MPHFLVISTESKWAYSMELLPGETYRIGRAENNHITLKDAWVSSYHARIAVDGEGVVLTDLESRNGVRVNEAPITTTRLNHHDRIRIGGTDILYVTQLDARTVGSQAFLSPKLSEPFMKTEVQKIASVTRALTQVRDNLFASSEHANGARDSIQSDATQLDLMIDRLNDIEQQARILVATNHFHEIFHKGTDLDSTLQSALRFITAAIEAESGAFIIKRNGRWLLQATTGQGVAGWRNGIPAPFQSLLESINPESPWAHLPNLGASARSMGLDQYELFEGDNRSVMLAGFHDSQGKIAGVAYFDNLTRPDWLTEESVGLATSCLEVVARYVLNDESIFGTHIAQRSRVVVEEPPSEHTRF